MAQLFLNNLETSFIASVQSVALTGTPATELGYGILQISDGAAGVLINPTGGDYYVLTAFKRAGTVESNVEVMRVTAVDNSTPGECRITVLRAQEGTTAQSYVSGDKLALRLTAAATNNWVQTDDPRMSNSRAPNGAAGGVLSGSFPNPAFAVDMATQAELDTKQDILVSGTNIKTVGGASILGSGDISVSTTYVNQGLNRWITTTATTFTVPAGVTSIRAYAIGGGGDGYRSVTQSQAGGGGGGGMAFGDIAVTPGASVTIGIASKVATVIYGGTTMLTANAGTAATSGAVGAGGTASKDAAVTNGGAYTGGAGATGTSGGGGGGAATPLGAGTAATTAGGGGLAKGGSVGTGGSGAGGANTGTIGGPSRSLQNAYTDFLLKGAVGCGGSVVSGELTGSPGEPGGGGAGVSGTTAITTTGGLGGDFGGGGGAYSTTTTGSVQIKGGVGGFLGGGGGAFASNTAPFAIAGDGGIGGGGGGAGTTNSGTAGTGGGAAVVIFY